jgi:hypothetical protein
MATAALVHETCAGKVQLHISPKQYGHITHEQLGSWLAGHARLLRQLHLEIHESPHDAELEEYAAAGLRAAVGVCAATGFPSTQAFKGNPELPFIVQAEETALQGYLLSQGLVLAGLPQQIQASGWLPLQELQLQGPLSGTLLPSIAASCGRSTQLQMHANTCEAPPFPLISFMLNLREVWVQWPGDDILREGVNQTSCSLSTLSSLTQLTKLKMPIRVIGEQGKLAHESFKHLPCSLHELCAEVSPELLPGSVAPDLRHLTNLTRLTTTAVHDAHLLPEQLHELHVMVFNWDEAYAKLQQLRSITLTIYGAERVADAGNQNLGPLTACTQLTALRLRTIREHNSAQTLSELWGQLHKLPLKHLQSEQERFTANDVRHVGQCTQLTALLLTNSALDVSAGAFSRQLQHLQALKRLVLNEVHFTPRVETSDDVQPLVAAIEQLCGKALSNVIVWGLPLSDEQQAVFRGLLGTSFELLENFEQERFWHGADQPWDVLDLEFIGDISWPYIGGGDACTH